MTYHDKFWKQHDAFFESIFQPQEEVIYIEKLSWKDSWIFGSICVITALFFSCIAAICVYAQAFTWLIFVMALVLLTLVLLFYSSGLFSQATLVLTSHAVYYCRGADCDIVFECRFASIDEIEISRKELLLLSNETYNHHIERFAMPFCAPISGRLNFLKNKWKKLIGKKTSSKLFSFTRLERMVFGVPPRQYFLDMPLQKDSQVKQHLGEVLKNHPQIKVKEID